MEHVRVEQHACGVGVVEQQACRSNINSVIACELAAAIPTLGCNIHCKRESNLRDLHMYRNNVALAGHCCLPPATNARNHVVKPQAVVPALILVEQAGWQTLPTSICLRTAGSLMTWAVVRQSANNHGSKSYSCLQLHRPFDQTGDSGYHKMPHARRIDDVSRS